MCCFVPLLLFRSDSVTGAPPGDIIHDRPSCYFYRPIMGQFNIFPHIYFCWILSAVLVPLLWSRIIVISIGKLRKLLSVLWYLMLSAHRILALWNEGSHGAEAAPCVCSKFPLKPRWCWEWIDILNSKQKCNLYIGWKLFLFWPLACNSSTQEADAGESRG